MDSFQKVRKDFDDIAVLDEGWTHNSFFYNFLNRHVPWNCIDILEVGCGLGEFTRIIALKSEHVLAVDLSPEMIRMANLNSTTFRNIDYRIENILDYIWPENHFDCIVSIATLHHLPLAFMLEKMVFSIKPGGRLIILDMLKAENLTDFLLGAVSFPLSRVMMLIKNGRLKEPEHIRRAWEEHGKNEIYMRFSELRRICNIHIPDAEIRRHLLWRYSIVWTKQ
ncbi:MAG TPA: class I SAM-dependent methyltransferase [Desulfomonilia bacterium]